MTKELQGFQKNWLFFKGDHPDAWQKWHATPDWRSVELPHDWSVEGPFSKEHSSGTGYLQGGTAWYRKYFELSEEDRGKRVFVLFEGAYKNSQVWLNSYYLGKRPFGYIPFMYDISEQANWGEENLLAVRLEHEDIADSRWFTGSGLTRPVRIFITDPVYLVHGGVFFRTEALENVNENGRVGDAQIAVDVEVANRSDAAATATVRLTLLGETIEQDVDLDVGETRKITLQTTLQKVDLWSSEHPALHDLNVSVEAGEYHDETNLRVGVRGFSFDPDEGFFVNGVSQKLKGLCIHHDAGALGAAVPKDVWRRRFEGFKRIGANAIRTSHNPQDRAIYELCDEMGFYCIDEIYDEWEGPKNKWSTGHNVYPPKHQGYYHDFPQWYPQDVADWMRRDRNYASIFAWSIGNEIDYPNDPYNHPMFLDMTGNNDHNKPAAERQYNSDKPNAERLIPIAKALIQEVRRHDPDRPVTLGFAYPELSTETGLTEPFDLIGYNYKEHLYAKDHERFPDKPLLGSENGKGYREWVYVRDHAYVSGQFLWTGIDFLGEAQGWPIRVSGAGLFTMAGYPKEEAYERQAMWTEAPIARLVTCPEPNEATSHWQPVLHDWNYAEGQRVIVRCFTNGKRASLQLNGRSLGEADFDEQRGWIEWIVPFEAGTLQVKVPMDDGSTATDTLVTLGRPTCIRLKPWTSDEVTAEDSSFVQVELELTNDEGLVIENAESLLWFSLEGDAVIKGIESGDIMDLVEYSARYRRAHRGRLIIYIKKASAETNVTLKVSGDTLEAQTLAI